MLERFPGGSPWLFPAIHSNIDGSRYASGTRLRQQLERWLEELDLVDEHGRPIRVTFHQFRHTVGTRLINAGVPQPVVQALLDHMSPDMTAIYARACTTKHCVSTGSRLSSSTLMVNPRRSPPITPSPTRPGRSSAWSARRSPCRTDTAAPRSKPTANMPTPAWTADSSSPPPNSSASIAVNARTPHA
ncbi:tyrosine-type recombinase/integrase [Nocardia fusca]|uniref:tyrosine-type recombinase/integrase n=1 Tax=Nocardia fusca TaxID=941183 RepID=UPI00350E5B1A